MIQPGIIIICADVVHFTKMVNLVQAISYKSHILLGRADPESMFSILMDARQVCYRNLIPSIANALSWTLFLLSHHPKIENILFEEINPVIGNRRPSSGTS